MAASALLLGACAATAPTAPLHHANPELALCTQWFAQRDAATDAAGVRDGAAHRVPHLPHLRVDRFSASLAQDARGSIAAWDAWVARLRALDAQARGHELANLVTAQGDSAQEGVVDREATRVRDAACAERLTQELARHADQRQHLAQHAQVPDDYLTARRVAGVYALTRWPFFWGVQRWQSSAREAFAAQAMQAQTPSAWTRYALGGERPSTAQIRAALSSAAPDALGVPQLNAAAQQVLLRAYAPSLEVHTRGAFDRIGALRWGGGKKPVVDTAQPLAYQRVAFTRYGAQTWVQLIYSFWFPERPASGALDLLSGALDAVVLRVTLGPDGAPVMVDTIHACGCYHLFIPTEALQPIPGPQWQEWAFVPTTLPRMGVGQRVQVVVASASHYVVGVRPDADLPATPYALRDEDILRALPLPGGGTRSVFGANGIIAGTERAERFLFWPMGIESPGAMRQWGRQPSAFVGRRHFDDARLMEERFKLR